VIFKGSAQGDVEEKAQSHQTIRQSNRLGVKTPSVLTDVLYADNTNYLEDNVASKQ
jgi:hypothetical protein